MELNLITALILQHGELDRITGTPGAARGLVPSV